MKENKNKAEKLNKKEEEKVTGGYIYCIQNPGTHFKYALIKDTGHKTIGEYETLEEAMYYAGLNGVSPRVLTDNELLELKATPNFHITASAYLKSRRSSNK